MKDMTTSNRMQVLVSNVFDVLKPQGDSLLKSHPEKELYRERCERPERKDFSCYMQVIDHHSNELVGHLADISSGGFKLDSLKPIPANKDFRFRIELTYEVADKPYLVFVARSRWCKVDPVDPFVYNIGFQLINIAPGDTEIFHCMMAKYGAKKENRSIDMRRSNMW